MSKLRKIFFVLECKLIKCIDYFSPRKYMKLYNSYLKKIGIHIEGNPRYIHPSVDFDGKGYHLTFIGDNVVISKDVLILNHDYSISCGLRSIGELPDNKEAFWLKEIRIGNNVFIGARTIILPGTNIGDNCIIGAGSVIKGNIEENSIVMGNPMSEFAKNTEWAIGKKNSNDFEWEIGK